MTNNETSKLISLILRHKPGIIGISLDEHGWANVDELITGINKTHPLSMETLEEIVRTDEKQRYSFNENKTKIRANQGHSIPVDVNLEKAIPPKYLYHGTGDKFVASIEEHGLIPKSRLYVHLTNDYDTAIKIGSRHGKPVVFQINANNMCKDGYDFYISSNGVWLTKYVPPKYFNRDCFDFSTVSLIVIELKKEFANDDSGIIDDLFIPKYGWEYVQQALFQLLMDDNNSTDIYLYVANVFWDAVLDGLKIDKETAIGLLYYRLGDINNPYENNTIWSITTELYGLDYCNSDYNPLKDDKILKKLALCGININ